MPGRLNIFQQTMLQWTELHPYNAIHVVRVPARLDRERLTQVAGRTLERLGLTGLTLDVPRKEYRYEGGPARCDIKLLIATDPYAALVTEIEQQLNTRFASSARFEPFRFFVVPEAEAFSLGLVYFHAIADAEAVVFLLKRIVEAYLSAGTAGPAETVEIYPECRDGLLNQPMLLAKKLASLPGWVLNTRRSCRPPYRDALDLQNGFTRFALPPNSLPQLIQAGRAWGVTVNDLLLALLTHGLAPMAARHQSARRQKISLGCIVNLRRDLGLAGPRTFGLFLGSFNITLAIPSGGCLQETSLAVQIQTEQVKGQRLYLTSGLEMRFARRMLGFFSTERRKKLYQKNYPLWGGITNMNLNPLWPQSQDGKRVDYFRAVSTGPATPLVVSVTTVGETMNVGLSFRRTVFSAAEIAGLQQKMLATLGSLEIPA
jgi:NRPS condensation-like uncharacterized protein